MQLLYENDENILDKCNDLMKKLHTSKNLAALRKKTKLVPKRRQETRWSGTFIMIERFLPAGCPTNNGRFPSGLSPAGAS
jgi:hypothetical protein